MTELPIGSDAAFWAAFDRLTAETDLVIDRPRGSRHPRFPDRVYPLDYGYLDGTTATDGGGVDVWRGSEPRPHVVGLIVTVRLAKRDAEVKLLLGCGNAEIDAALAFHNATASMRGTLVRRGVVGDEGLEPPTSSV